MQKDRHEISKDKDSQDLLAGIKELARELMQIRERAAIEYAPIVEEFCARKHASENEVERMLDHLFEFADDERILLMYKKVCRRFVYEYPEAISFYIMEYRKNMIARVLSGPNTNICFTRTTTCLTKGAKQNSRLRRKESYLLKPALNHKIYHIFFFYID